MDVCVLPRATAHKPHHSNLGPVATVWSRPIGFCCCATVTAGQKLGPTNPRPHQPVKKVWSMPTAFCCCAIVTHRQKSGPPNAEAHQSSVPPLSPTLVTVTPSMAGVHFGPLNAPNPPVPAIIQTRGLRHLPSLGRLGPVAVSLCNSRKMDPVAWNQFAEVAVSRNTTVEAFIGYK